ncbi:MAG TPA: gamma-glutamyltransferase [Phycisphaerales bacterium]|nr:gamma-glutamyltransferase [Phycisphaerales bacterium]
MNRVSVPRKGVIAAGFPLAAEAGAAMLRGGGNAIDAACAAAWALSVCESAESGLGGHTVMLVRLASGRVFVIDGHSHAPASLRRKLVTTREQAEGIKATTIPSTVATLIYAQQKYGTQPLATALAPAIDIAERGYAITKLQRKLISWVAPRWERGSVESNTFLHRHAVPHAGFLLRQPLLARTLERISTHGADDFYRGSIAHELVRDMEARSGLLSGSDLASLTLPIERQPLVAEIAGRRVFSTPPAGGGVQVLLALQMLEQLRLDAPDDCLPIHLIHALRRSFAERDRWPEHPDDFTHTLARWLVSKERAHAVLQRQTAGVQGAFREPGNTTHLCAADSDGNVVALTQSIQSVFGAKSMHPTLGFFYNNYLSACPREKHCYRLRGACTPMSNAAPTLMTDAHGAPLVAIGSAGSRRITSSIVQVLARVLWAGSSLRDAVDAPRIHTLDAERLWMERGVSDEQLACIGAHARIARTYSRYSYKLGAVHALAWDSSGTAQGVADPRRDGAVVTVQECPA